MIRHLARETMRSEFLHGYNLSILKTKRELLVVYFFDE